MPAAVLGVLAYPFGLDGPVWQLMGAAVAQVLEVSAWVSGFAGSTVVVPALGIGALGLLSLGAPPADAAGLVPALARRACRPAPASPSRRRPSATTSSSTGTVRAPPSAAPDGRLALVGRPSAFVAEQWLRADGDGTLADDASLRRDARCDRAGCVVEGA